MRETLRPYLWAFRCEFPPPARSTATPLTRIDSALGLLPKASLLLVLSFVAFGCAPGGHFSAEQPRPLQRELVTTGPPVRVASAELDAADEALYAGSALAQQMLESSVRGWLGTRYRYGGTTRRGVDCSAFMQNVYREAFGIQLPRTTASQVGVGRAVSRSELQPGDLVLFRTGRGRRHVGVYLGGGRLAHASSSRGVVIDDLDSSYWRRTYWTSRRVLPETPRRVSRL